MAVINGAQIKEPRHCVILKLGKLLQLYTIIRYKQLNHYDHVHSNVNVFIALTGLKTRV